jgi:diguanylate cyclase (GGDEF)-like protein
MWLPGWVRHLQRRLTQKGEAEYVQSLVRLPIVAAGVVYLFAISPDASVADPENLYLGRRIVVLSFVVALALFLLVVANPGRSVIRRLCGISHDVIFLTCAMFLGEAASAPYAALYLLVTLGNGFRFGTGYLYFAATLSVVAFATVYLASDYWRSQGTLSFNIFMVLTVVPFYVARLLASLHHTRDLLTKQATHDSLTGLLSRGEFESLVQHAMAREPGDHALLFCDLDRFKAVNDVAGHAAGDKLLADVGAIISRSIRALDFCGRTGGDEFCVLLRRCTLEQAREVAEQIRSRVAGYRLAWGREYFSVGISIGAAPTSAVADSNSLFRLADAACYAAKNAGRNQIHVVDPRVDTIDTGQVRRLFIDAAGNAIVSTDARVNTPGRRPGPQ